MPSNFNVNQNNPDNSYIDIDVAGQRISAYFTVEKDMVVFRIDDGDSEAFININRETAEDVAKWLNERLAKK